MTFGLLALSAVLYAAGVRAIWRQAGAGRGIARWQVVTFVLALLSIVVALESPIDWLADALFSAHMTQHEILMLISAPLLVLAQPLLALLWALPPRLRQAVAVPMRAERATRAWHALTAPLVVFLVHGVAVWVWHVPSLFEWALAHEGVHAVQHLMFFWTAALFWWAMVHGRFGRGGYGIAVLYVFLTCVHSSVLGALATLADRPWYPSYILRAANQRVDALADQQLAGLIMWIPSGVIFMVVGLALFAAWLGESEKRARVSQTASLR